MDFTYIYITLLTSESRLGVSKNRVFRENTPKKCSISGKHDDHPLLLENSFVRFRVQRCRQKNRRL